MTTAWNLEVISDMGRQWGLVICAAATCLMVLRPAEAATVTVDTALLYTTVDDPDLHITGTGSGFDSVVKLTIGRPDGTFTCTGALLSNGRDVLTAAHCLTDDVGNLTATSSFSLFQTQYGSASLPSSSFTVHPNWNGDFNLGNDIAIVHLGRLAPLGADGHEIYRGSNEIGQVVTKAGYGQTGTGSTGATLPSGTRRSGMNTYDSLGDAFTGLLDTDPIPGAHLVYDFDDGTAEHDAFGFFESMLGGNNLAHTGLGNDEVLSASGDSGGPTFINNQIAGVTSFGLRLDRRIGPRPRTSDIDDELNASFGEFAFDTRVSFYADWVDAHLSVPPPFINGDLNGDGFVGIEDLNLVLNRWNQDVSATPVRLAGDPTGDGFVGIEDLNIVLGDWNLGTPPTLANASVPEPGTLAVLALGLTACLRKRRPGPYASRSTTS